MANEKRLIDANALAEMIQSFTMVVTGLRAGKGVLSKYAEEYRKSVLKTIDEAPTVEVAEMKWIPVSERLPQEDEPEGTTCEQVQVLLDNGVVSTGWCNRHTKLWWHLNYGETHFIGYDYEHTPVVAWQPLAQPPKGE